MANVFISYAAEDRGIANELSAMLQADGQSVFFDHAIAAGTNFSESIGKALAESKAVVVLLSRNSNRSKWVEMELRAALQRGHVVIPVLLDDEATNNWVWPLISDRQAIRIDSPTGIEEVVRAVNRAVGWMASSNAEELTLAAPPSAVHPSAVHSRWLIVLVAILSAVAGALVMWFLR